jgi:hypothetical protein
MPSHFFALSKALNVTPGLLSWLATLQTLTLVASPRLGLRHVGYMGSMSYSCSFMVVDEKMNCSCKGL